MTAFSYIDVPFDIDFDRAASTVRHRVLDFVGEYFRAQEGRNGEPTFSLRVHSRKSAFEKEVLAHGRPTLIHNSKKPSYYEPGLRVDGGLFTYIYNEATRGLYEINRLSDEVDICNPDPLAIARDVSRLARDLVKVSVETLRGGVLLHCAAVAQPDGGVVLLVGNKGCGKSTVMLNLIFRHGYKEVSRDRTFLTLSESGELFAHGFPNYYNLTARTIRSLAPIRHLLPSKVAGLSDEELDGVEEKWPFDAEELGIDRSMRGAPGRVARIVILEPGTELRDSLAVSCFTPHDPNYPNWHDWLPRGHGPICWRPIVDLLEARCEPLYWKNDLDGCVRRFAAGRPLERAHPRRSGSALERSGT